MEGLLDLASSVGTLCQCRYSTHGLPAMARFVRAGRGREVLGYLLVKKEYKKKRKESKTFEKEKPKTICYVKGIYQCVSHT